MAWSGFGGNERIAQVLARTGQRISKRTVGRILKENVPKNPVPELDGETKPRRVSGKYPNHTVLIDTTDIPGVFRLITFKLVVVLDVFSRMPLSWRMFPKERMAVQVTAVVEEVAKGPGAKLHNVRVSGTALNLSRRFFKTRWTLSAFSPDSARSESRARLRSSKDCGVA